MNILTVSADTAACVETADPYEELFTDLEFLVPEETFDDFSYELINGVLNIEFAIEFEKSNLPDFTIPGYPYLDPIIVAYRVTYDSNRYAIYIEEYIRESIGSLEILYITDQIPGLIVNDNGNGQRDVMLYANGEDCWLSSIPELSGFVDAVLPINQTSVYNLNSFWDFCGGIASDWLQGCSEVVGIIFRPVVELVVKVVDAITPDQEAMEWATDVLDMEYNEGFSTAQVNCWQHEWGYNDVYDFAFNAATSMREAKFPFDVDNDGINDYIFWAWKGNYLNLGAGAEMGIYERFRKGPIVTPHWEVNFNLKMEMSLVLYRIGSEEPIFTHHPDELQWWITGFKTGEITEEYPEGNKEYLYLDRDELIACYTVRFHDPSLYSAFKSDFQLPSPDLFEPDYYEYSFNDDTRTWTFQF